VDLPIKNFMVKWAGKIESLGKIQRMVLFRLIEIFSGLAEKILSSTEQTHIGIADVNGWVSEDVKKAHWINPSEFFCVLLVQLLPLFRLSSSSRSRA
jgi:hypothetical protein